MIRPPTFPLLVLLLVGGGSASALAEGKDPVPSSGEQISEGRLLVVRGLDGGEPQLTDHKGNRYLLQGLARPELLRLDGHQVKVWGAPGEKKLMTPTLTVKRYTILGTGRRAPPLVGVLGVGENEQLQLVPEAGGGAVVFKGGRSILRKLRKRVGCKVWVVVSKRKSKGKSKADAAVRVRKFGWLLCSPGHKGGIKKGKASSGEKGPEPGKTKKGD